MASEENTTKCIRCGQTFKVGLGNPRNRCLGCNAFEGRLRVIREAKSGKEDKGFCRELADGFALISANEDEE